MPPLTLDGTTGVSAVQAGSIQSDDLAAGVGGKVLQVVQSSSNSQVISTSSSYVDTQLSASISLSSTSNKVLVLVFQPVVLQADGGSFAQGSCEIRLVKDSNNILYEPFSGNFLRLSADESSVNSELRSASIGTISVLDTASSLNHTYKTQFSADGNGSKAITGANGTVSTITLMEIAG